MLLVSVCMLVCCLLLACGLLFSLLSLLRLVDVLLWLLLFVYFAVGVCLFDLRAGNLFVGCLICLLIALCEGVLG